MSAKDRLPPTSEGAAFVGAFVVFLVTLASLLYLSVGIFGGFPFTHDEYTNLYQATIFSQGKLYLQASEQMRALIEPCMVLADGHLFSKYPPGFSAVLALGVLAKMPELVNPLISACTTAILFLGIYRLSGWFPAACAMALLVTSALLQGYGGSYFAQPLSLLLTTAGFVQLLRYGRSCRVRDAAFAGMAAGFLFPVRPLDAVCLIVSLLAGIVLAAKARWVKPLAAAALATAAGVAVLFVVNFETSGQWGVAVIPIWDWEFRVVDVRAHSAIENLAQVAKWFSDSLDDYTWPTLFDNYLPYLGPGLGVLALAGAWVMDKTISLTCILFCLLIAGLYTFHPNLGYPLYGARYWYPTLAPVTILASGGLRYLCDRRSHWLVGSLVGLVVIAQLAFCREQWKEYDRRFAAINDVRQAIETTCPPHSVVVLGDLRIRPGGWPHYVNTAILKRNPFLNGDRLFVLNGQDARAAAQILPGYGICNFPAGSAVPSSH